MRILTLVSFLFLTVGELAASAGTPAFHWYFRENRGQWEGDVRFRCTNGERDIAFYKDKMVFSTRKTIDPGLPQEGDLPHQQRFAKYEFLTYAVHFPGSNPNVEVAGVGQSSAYVNYITTNNAGAPIRKVPDYEAMEYRDLYPGIHLRFSVKDSLLKYDIFLEPGARLEQLRMVYEGIDKLEAMGSTLKVKTAWFELREIIPASFTGNGENSKEIPVQVNYHLLNDTTVGFTAQGYQPGQWLLIDPMHMDWSTYFYGNIATNNSWVYDVDVDEKDYVYITGYTTDKFPGKPGIYDTTFNGGTSDCYICRMPLEGKTIDYFTYIGGSGYEYGFSLALTLDGRVFATGITTSSNFPTTSGVMEPSASGSGWSGFLFGLKGDGSTLIYSTYVGAGGSTWSLGMDVNEKGEVFLAPYTNASLTVTHPMLPPGFVTTNPDCYILKIKDDGSRLLQSTRFGGDGFEYTTSLFVDKRNNVYITGYTTSQNLPATGGFAGFGGLFRGQYDGYLFKIDSGFTRWMVSKYLGTTGFDYTTSVTVNDLDEIFVTGITNGTGFPNPTNSPSGGGYQAFALKMKADGTYPFWTTYVGSSFYSWRQRIAVTAKDELIMTGNTNSTSFPVSNDAFQKLLKGSSDGFIAKLNPRGDMEYATYYGGSSWDYLYAAAARRIGCVTHLVMAGYSNSSDFPTLNAWKPSVSRLSYSGVVGKFRDTLKITDIDLGSDRVYCNTLAQVLDAGNKGASYRWSTNDTTRRITVRKPGTYTVRASYGCGWRSDTIKLELNYSPRKPNLRDTLLCNNDSARFDARNDTIPRVTYRWTNGDSTRFAKATDTGWLGVTVTTRWCGRVQDSARITKIFTPVVDLGKDTTICMPGSLSLDAGNENNQCKYSWNTGDTTARLPTTYTWNYQVTVQNRCGVARDTVEIFYDTFPVSKLPRDSMFCDAVNMRLLAGSSNNWGKIRWSTNDSGSLLVVRKPGTYWIYQYNACGNSSDTIKLSMVKTPTAALRNDTLLCTVRQLSLRTRGMDSARYEWKNNSGPWQTGDTIWNANAVGKWFVRVSNRCGSAGDSVLLRFDSIPRVNIPWTDSLVCNLGSLQIEAAVTGLSRNIAWRHGGSSVIANVSNDGTYLIRTWNDCGETSDSVRVRFDVAPQVNLPNGEQFCDVMPERVLDGTSSSGKNVRYAWNTGESVPVLRVNNAGFYRVRASNDCGTAADSVRYIMLASPQPQLPPDTSFCGNFSYALAPLNADPAWVYRWNDGSGSANRMVRDFGLYELEVADTVGCKGKASTTVFNSCNTRVWVPDAFTPGVSKGMNDVFKADIYETEYMEFRVFNRWGQEVFFTKDPAAGWDGTFNGKPCAEGVYAWSLYYRGGFFRGSMKGTVHLLR